MINNEQLEKNVIKSFEFVREDILKIFNILEILKRENEQLKLHNKLITREIMELHNKLLDKRISKGFGLN